MNNNDDTNSFDEHNARLCALHLVEAPEPAATVVGDAALEPKSPFLVVLDEFFYYADMGNKLKEALREMPGVPNAQYLVDGEKVFVFEKLGSCSWSGAPVTRRPSSPKTPPPTVTAARGWEPSWTSSGWAAPSTPARSRRPSRWPTSA